MSEMDGTSNASPPTYAPALQAAANNIARPIQDEIDQQNADIEKAIYSTAAADDKVRPPAAAAQNNAYPSPYLASGKALPTHALQAMVETNAPAYHRTATRTARARCFHLPLPLTVV
ncbi:hypothetical protein B0A50_03887 [Salinomyces thailandicus]|uniref:Uncharacterized protein n=1 Tax=Salinomyces thailandicus TaxID=706561 RepID=A0A4U0U0L9_9PEZI|nr:hypothetical protein B0A50_03887 [Salinomyces thailandica]